MKILVQFFMFFCFFQSFAQNLTIGDKGYIIGLKENSNWETKPENYFNKTVAIRILDKKTSLILELYQRFDDSSFLFSSFNDKGNIISKGLLKLSKEVGKRETWMVPDWKKDFTGATMKDSNIYEYKYLKSSFWIETDSSGFVRKGYYKHNIKNGEWATFNNEGENQHLLNIEIFKHGKPVENNLIVWPLIKGKWYQMRQPDTSIIIYKRIPYHFSDMLMFKSSKLFEIFIPVSLDSSTHYESKWDYKNDIIQLDNVDNKDLRFKILKLDKDELIFKIIE